jgi:hypothetical protein
MTMIRVSANSFGIFFSSIPKNSFQEPIVCNCHAQTTGSVLSWSLLYQQNTQLSLSLKWKELKANTPKTQNET